MGKGKIITQLDEEVILDNFSINFNLYAYGEDKGGGMGSSSTATVGVRTHLSEVDEALAQEITDDIYQYFVDQWKQRGVTVVVPEVSDIEGAKKYAKAKKKGKGKIVQGGAIETKEKKKHYIMAWPQGTNVAYSGEGPLAANGNFANMLMEMVAKNASYTAFNSTVNFMSFKTAALGTTASVTAKPQLVAANSMSAGKWTKNKTGAYLGSNEADGAKEFYTKVDKDGFEWLGASSNDWNYIADKAKYKSNVTEMLKKSIDDMFLDFEEVVAKNTK